MAPRGAGARTISANSGSAHPGPRNQSLSSGRIRRCPERRDRAVRAVPLRMSSVTGVRADSTLDGPARWIPDPRSARLAGVLAAISTRCGERAVSADQSARAGELAAEYDDQYDLAMERITATLEPETLRQIRRVAGPRGVSKFLSMAARERLARLELLGLLDDLDAKHGAPEKAVARKVKRDASRIFRR